MKPFEIVAQIIGIFAMAFNIWSYQQKQQKHIIALQLRALVFLYKDQLKSDRVLWLIGFICVYCVSYVLTFTALGKEWNALNGIIELLPVIGSTAITLAYRSKNAKSTRLLGLIVSPSWLIYNIVFLSIGAICCEILSIISIVVGFFRLDKNTKE